jgi:hypothetical protein
MAGGEISRARLLIKPGSAENSTCIAQPNASSPAQAFVGLSMKKPLIKQMTVFSKQ